MKGESNVQRTYDFRLLGRGGCSAPPRPSVCPSNDSNRSPPSEWVFKGELELQDDVRGPFGHKVQTGHSSLITPDIFKLLESYESPRYLLQMGVW